MWVFCESHQGKKARPSGPPGGASLLVNRNDVRPRYAGPKDDSLSQDPNSGGGEFAKQTATDTT